MSRLRLVLLLLLIVPACQPQAPPAKEPSNGRPVERDRSSFVVWIKTRDLGDAQGKSIELAVEQRFGRAEAYGQDSYKAMLGKEFQGILATTRNEEGVAVSILLDLLVPEKIMLGQESAMYVNTVVPVEVRVEDGAGILLNGVESPVRVSASSNEILLSLSEQPGVPRGEGARKTPIPSDF